MKNREMKNREMKNREMKIEKYLFTNFKCIRCDIESS